MSKYSPLWEYVAGSTEPQMKLDYIQIENICGVLVDHSFLKYKKELEEYGWHVEKISMKEQSILFAKKV